MATDMNFKMGDWLGIKWVESVEWVSQPAEAQTILKNNSKHFPTRQ